VLRRNKAEIKARNTKASRLNQMNKRRTELFTTKCLLAQRQKLANFRTGHVTYTPAVWILSIPNCFLLILHIRIRTILPEQRFLGWHQVLLLEQFLEETVISEVGNSAHFWHNYLKRILFCDIYDQLRLSEIQRKWLAPIIYVEFKGVLIDSDVRV